MRRLRYRWLLPIGHLLIDSFLLAVWVWHADQLLHWERSRVSDRQFINAAAFLQEGDTVGWDPRDVPLPPEFRLLASGNLPGAVVSMKARPAAHMQWRGKLWDPTWFLIHEATSFPIWFLIGVRLDSGRSRLRSLMMGYLAARVGFAVLSLPSPYSAAKLGAVLEGLFWLGLGVYTAIAAAQWSLHRLRPRTP